MPRYEEGGGGRDKGSPPKGLEYCTVELVEAPGDFGQSQAGTDQLGLGSAPFQKSRFRVILKSTDLAQLLSLGGKVKGGGGDLIEIPFFVGDCTIRREGDE